MFEDERATETALTFLRDTKFGYAVYLVPPGEEEWEDVGKEEESPGPRQDEEGERVRSALECSRFLRLSFA